jgi:hypothetical protein
MIISDGYNPQTETEQMFIQQSIERILCSLDINEREHITCLELDNKICRNEASHQKYIAQNMNNKRNIADYKALVEARRER